MKKTYLLALTLLPFMCLGASYDATVVRVVDGDTVILNWDGYDERVRIVGIDTPETVAENRPVECFGPQASAYAKQLLPIDSQVIFEYNQERDKYDRALGYVTLPDGRDFGRIMIDDGYARAYRSFPHERLDDYAAAESSARTAELGLWAPNACLSTDRPTDTTTSSKTHDSIYIQVFWSWINALLNWL